MRLELTVVSAPGGLLGDPVELCVDVPVGSSGSVLALEFAGRWPNATFSVAGQPLAALVAGTPPLVSGAIVVAGPAGTPGSPGVPVRRKSPALALAVLTGPDAGAVFALRRGRYRIGRGRVEISIQDPGLSRVHAELEVGERFITLRPASRSGCFLVDGAAVRGPAVTVDRTIGFGTTSVMLTFLPVPAAPPTGTDLEPLVIHRPHGGLRGKGTLLATSALPLTLGVCLAILTGQLMFMAFAAMSAITALGPLFCVRRRRIFRQELASAVRLDSRRRLAGAPSAADLVLGGFAPSDLLIPDDASRPRTRAFPADGRGGEDGNQAGGKGHCVDDKTNNIGEMSNRAGTGKGGGLRAATGIKSPGPAIVQLRVGTAELPADIVTEPADAHFTPPLLPGMPVVVALGEPYVARSAGMPGRIHTSQRTSVHAELNIAGPSELIAGLVRFLLMQLDSAGIRTVVAGPVDRLPLAARFLPHVSITADADTLAAQLGHPGPVVVIHTAAPAGSAGSTTPPDPGQNPAQGISFIRCRPSEMTGGGLAIGGGDAAGAELAAVAAAATGSSGAAGAAWIRLGAASGSPHALLGSVAFEPDLVSAATFDRYARRRAAAAGTCAADRTPGKSVDVVPAQCSLTELTELTGLAGLAGLAGSSAQSVSGNWSRHRSAVLAAVPIGMAANGPLLLDLERDGPHLLVAGTTGSGKSELLRTLVVSLALSHPPAAMQLLFLDFKGGSGLGPLADLPHCAALVTDISGHGLTRVLTSLRTETRRRESLFGRAEAEDIRSYTASASEGLPPVPHLVVVIDEFRMLVEQAPEALSELMRIAATGRSLGIHLVMATQRPQGAISADIRANVTTSVCLRVQSGYESLDVINSPLAGAIPLTLPGRAYISRGGALPIEFQAAVLGTLQAHSIGPRIRTARLAALEAPAVRRVAAPDAMSAALKLTGVLAAAHALTGEALPAPPLAPELPELLSLEQVPISQPGQIPLGFLDVPERQCVVPLTWDPAQQSHLALVGPPAGALTAVCSLIVEQLLQRRDLDPWLYCLDGDGSLSALAGDSAVGTYLEPGDLRSAARLLQLLAGAADAPHPAAAASGTVHPRLILAVTGWGRWLSALRSSPWPWCEDLLADIVRDGSGSGITVVISGERELVASRFVAGIPNRIFFPLGASAESMLAWPRLPAVSACPGRALVVGKIGEDAAGPSCAAASHPAQLALPGTYAGTYADGGVRSGDRPTPPVARQSHDKPKDGDPLRGNPSRGKAPFRLRALPAEVLIGDVLAALDTDARGAADPGNVLLGLGGDNLDPIFVRLERGSVLLGIGPHRSGKTTLLDTLPLLNTRRFDWARPGPDFRAEGFPERDYLAAASESGRNGRILVLLLDDVETLPEPAQLAIFRLLGAGAVVIATADSILSGQGRIPLAAEARRHGLGLVFAPRRPSDGDFFNCRIDTHGQVPPGRGVLLDRGSATWLQLPRMASAAGQNRP